MEPQEKKKTPKGRAKKRITYTRRFVNVTMTGGKRKVSPQKAQYFRVQIYSGFDYVTDDLIDESESNNIDCDYCDWLF